MQLESTNHRGPYKLGLPMWSNRHWVGSLFAVGASSQSYLHSYSSVFSSVEGNTTFYALPSASTVSSWKEQIQKGFQFCFKLPRTITHGTVSSGHNLCNHQKQLTEFFCRLEPLSETLGPFMIQLPERFSPSYLGQLQRFIDTLPECFAFSVEVRHPDFFNRQEQERSLNQLLHSKGIDRVCLDSRALFSRAAQTEQERDAHKKKPRLPVHAVATAQQPIIRFIGCSDLQHNIQYFLPWVNKLAQWCAQNIHPIIFIHTPNNLHAPQQAFTFHQLLKNITGWQPLSRELKDESQLSIF